MFFTGIVANIEMLFACILVRHALCFFSVDFFPLEDLPFLGPAICPVFPLTHLTNLQGLQLRTRRSLPTLGDQLPSAFQFRLFPLAILKMQRRLIK